MILSLSIAANDHPDHDTIAAFRRRFLDRIEGLFVEVLLLAREARHGGAGRHQGARQREPAQRAVVETPCELEARLKAEVAELMALAEAADGADVLSVPEELARREDRLARIAEAKAVIEARARERLERERAEYEAKLEARAEKAEKTGRKPGGRPPEPPVAGPGPKDQVNLTDADSRNAGGRRRLRTGLQRPSPGGGRQPAGGHQRRGPGPQRQATNRAGAGSARPPSRGAGRARDPAGGQRLLQRGQRDTPAPRPRSRR